jgi:hypothetical protein
MEIKLYYIKENLRREHGWLDYQTYINLHGKVDMDNYLNVYTYEAKGEWTKIIGNKKAHSVLDEVWVKFNLKHPIDFKSRSLSVGDLIMISNKYIYYVDSFGFIPINARENDVVKEYA